MSKISLNTFLIAYQDQLGKIGVPESEWERYLATADELFGKLKGESSTTVSALPVAGFTNNLIGLLEPGEPHGSLWGE